MASLDNKVDFPIGIFYCENKGGAHYIEELYRKILDLSQLCSGCLKTDTIIVLARSWSAKYVPYLVILNGTHFFALVVSV